jgi:hypothetical protein
VSVFRVGIRLVDERLRLGTGPFRALFISSPGIDPAPYGVNAAVAALKEASRSPTWSTTSPRTHPRHRRHHGDIRSRPIGTHSSASATALKVMRGSMQTTRAPFSRALRRNIRCSGGYW